MKEKNDLQSEQDLLFVSRKINDVCSFLYSRDTVVTDTAVNKVPDSETPKNVLLSPDNHM